MFGWVQNMAAFQLCTDPIAYIMHKRGIPLHYYIDDYTAVSPEDTAAQAFHQLCDLLKELGLPLNKDKLTPTIKCLCCLGIGVNIVNKTMGIHSGKLLEINKCLIVQHKTHLR